jgi:hypothetical protein
LHDDFRACGQNRSVQVTLIERILRCFQAQLQDPKQSTQLVGGGGREERAVLDLTLAPERITLAHKFAKKVCLGRLCAYQHAEFSLLDLKCLLGGRNGQAELLERLDGQSLVAYHVKLAK